LVSLIQRQNTENLSDLGGGVGVDFQPDGDFYYNRRFPLHSHLLDLVLYDRTLRPPWRPVNSMA